MPDSSPIDFPSRQARLRERMQATGLDAVALNPGPSLAYLTGLHFHLSERPVIALFGTETGAVVALPELEAGKLEDVPYECRAFTYGEDPSTWTGAFRNAARAAGVGGRSIGVEPRRLRVLELRLLEDAAPDAAVVSGEAVLAGVRMYKDAFEIGRMREAVRVAQEAVRAATAQVRPGVTERELAAELTIQMLRAGSASELPFEPIVAFGAASANPHAVPGDRRLAEGDLVLVDWGANVDGYFSDLTRMFAYGDLDAELRRIADVVGRANAAGRAAAGPGVPAGEVDRAARRVITEAGYGEYFIHRTGHGLGLEGHEEPYIRDDNEEPLEEGMTFTIEPGIYLPGRGGARIEDDVVITADGAESLSDLDRELVRLDGR